MKVGAVVRLKSGGPLMTVNAEVNNDLCDVVWFDGVCYGNRTVAVAALEEVTQPVCTPKPLQLQKVDSGPGPAPNLEFRNDIETIINRHNAENESDTPDFILAEYLIDCLAVFDKAVRNCAFWHGDVRPQRQRLVEEQSLNKEAQRLAANDAATTRLADEIKTETEAELDAMIQEEQTLPKNAAQIQPKKPKPEKEKK